MNGQLWHKIKWVSYAKTIWEPKNNLKNAIKKVEKYYKKASQAVRRRKSQRKMNQLKMMDEMLETKTLLLKYQLFPPQLDWNLFWPPQLPVYKAFIQPDEALLNKLVFVPEINTNPLQQ